MSWTCEQFAKFISSRLTTPFGGPLKIETMLAGGYGVAAAAYATYGYNTHPEQSDTWIRSAVQLCEAFVAASDTPDTTAIEIGLALATIIGSPARLGTNTAGGSPLRGGYRFGLWDGCPGQQAMHAAADASVRAAYERSRELVGEPAAGDALVWIIYCGVDYRPAPAYAEGHQCQLHRVMSGLAGGELAPQIAFAFVMYNLPHINSLNWTISSLLAGEFEDPRARQRRLMLPPIIV